MAWMWSRSLEPHPRGSQRTPLAEQLLTRHHDTQNMRPIPPFTTQVSRPGESVAGLACLPHKAGRPGDAPLVLFRFRGIRHSGHISRKDPFPPRALPRRERDTILLNPSALVSPQGEGLGLRQDAAVRLHESHLGREFVRQPVGFLEHLHVHEVHDTIPVQVGPVGRRL